MKEQRTQTKAKRHEKEGKNGIEYRKPTASEDELSIVFIHIGYT